MAVSKSMVHVADGGGSGRYVDLERLREAQASAAATEAALKARLQASIAAHNQATAPTKNGRSSGGSGVSGAGAAASESPAIAAPTGDVNKTAYDLALEAAQGARGNAPTYAGTYDQQIADLAAQIAGRGAFQASGTYDQQIADLYEQINGRGDFSFDLNGDAFWQQYKDQYKQAAKAAMRDTMGQAAALTGGYGSSYGQVGGQQAYDRQMEKLMDVAPELYQMAYQRYTDEGDALMDKLALARQLGADEYSRAYQEYQDRGDALLDQLSIARQMANDEYSRYADDYSRWANERDYSDERLAAEQKQQQNNLAFLQSMMALGYTPTAQEVADAGLTTEQYQALAGAYLPQQKTVYVTKRETPAADDDEQSTQEISDTDLLREYLLWQAEQKLGGSTKPTGGRSAPTLGRVSLASR